MKKIYFANTNFEFEFIEKVLSSPIKNLEKSPICLQLQFLPFLFAEPENAVLITGFPKEHYLPLLQNQKLVLPELITEEKLKSGDELVTWGWSKNVAHFAKEKGLIYPMPNWEVVRQVNSKAWGFFHAPKLEGARLIFNKEDLLVWLKQKTAPTIVLKNCFGFSGRGHFLCDVSAPLTDNMLYFCEKEWKMNLPVLAEPWVERVLDFSTQWYVSSDEEKFLGATKMVNHPSGSYLGSVIGKEAFLFKDFPSILESHLVVAKEILRLIREKGYHGYIGIDAMVYHSGSDLRLHPVVEINARMTMALCALLIQKRHFPSKNLQFNYGKNGQGLLPNSLKLNSKNISFNRQLSVSLIE
ncbi:hypothetical protein PHSC3_000551 [Chlamydiales bacterium STE3]|nr:hypothetical protein PHSC3_000551 [Chlamydiales bacterium STE3]